MSTYCSKEGEKTKNLLLCSDKTKEKGNNKHLVVVRAAVL